VDPRKSGAVTMADRRRNLRELVETQAALRRLAVLIARDTPPSDVFTAVTGEVRRRYGAATARMVRFESDGTATMVANVGTIGPHVRVGGPWTGYPECGLTQKVWNTGRSARVDDYREVPGGEPYVSEGLVSGVAVPIYVAGRLWGFIAIGSVTGPLPADVERCLAEFTGLTATAIATAQSRAEIRASRARIVAAFDNARKRLERDLHDGAQQHLVSLALRVAMLSDCPGVSDSMRNQLKELSIGLDTVIGDLRELARGIHPAILSQAGLEPALRALAARSVLPVELRLGVPDRLPTSIESGAYYIAAEALANATKHAHATRVRIEAELGGAMLRVAVIDDGIGGADVRSGTGLLGLHDRAEALGGRLSVLSPTGGGTHIQFDIDCAATNVCCG